MSQTEPGMTSVKFREWLESVENVAPLLPSDVQVDERISIGGQGVVFRGFVDSVEAAIKIYFPGQVDKRIEREIHALTELQCTTIVDLLWSGKVDFLDRELNVVATNFVEGNPLNILLENNDPVDIYQIGIITYDVAFAIKAMWERRIVHRDLKPSNILIRPNERACVIDLGLARHLEDSSLTQLGASWGTYGYLSPEQAKGVRQLSCKSDIYSLGIILMESAMGRHPTFRDQLRLQAQNPHENLPREIASWEHADLLKQMLHPRPPKRPRPNDILNQLQRYAPS